MKLQQKGVPSIYLACLEARTGVSLHGEWIEVPGDLNALTEQVKALLGHPTVNGVKEWIINRYEYFGPFKIDKLESMESVCTKARIINSLEDYERAHFDLWVFDNFDKELTEDDEDSILYSFWECYPEF